MAHIARTSAPDPSPERSGRAPYVFTRLSPAKETIVFDSYWRFAAERQAILFRRARSVPAPWTQDPIIARHKFTNAYRAADRVSQYLISRVIYRGSQSPLEIVFRILLFKLFNKIETWELLESTMGWPEWRSFNATRYARVLSRAREADQPIYSAAYIMPTGRSSFGSTDKHKNHLALIEHMLKDGVAGRFAAAKSLGAVYEVLRGYPTLGPFLAFQLAIDVNYSTAIDFNEMSFVMPGPGAKDGIAKCFADRAGLSDVDLIKLTADRQDLEFEKRGLRFEQLGRRPLQLIDCQNLFCEVDKYARVAHPSISGISGRTRIKQVFSPRHDPIALWFPPKWGINDLVARQCGR